MGWGRGRVISQGSLSTWPLNSDLNEVGEQAMRVTLGKSVPARGNSEGRGPAWRTGIVYWSRGEGEAEGGGGRARLQGVVDHGKGFMLCPKCNTCC